MTLVTIKYKKNRYCHTKLPKRSKEAKEHKVGKISKVTISGQGGAKVQNTYVKDLLSL